MINNDDRNFHVLLRYSGNFTQTWIKNKPVNKIYAIQYLTTG